MWRRWKAGQGKLCFVSCSHQRASAGKYLFPQTQQGLQFVQLSARTQNDGPRLLAQKLPERDNQPRIIDGPERVRNITSLFRCFTVMSDRSDHPSVPTYLRRPSCFSVRLERRFSVPACNLTERWSQRRSREARSRAEPRAAASLRRAWRARRALDLDGPLRPAQRLIRLGASELPLPLPTIPTARREAEAGSPSKSVTTTPSIAVILLTIQTSLMLRAAFKLPLRQTEGLMASVLTLMDLTISAPDHTTVSRRAVTLPVVQPASVPHGPLHVLIDSTGLQVFGAGQWLEAKHGAKSRRKWRKLHLAVDAASGMIVAQTLTDQDADDPSQAAPLLDQIGGPIVRVTADGAYDGAPTYQTIAAHGDDIEVVIPPRSTAVSSSEPDSPTQRDRHLAMI